MKLTPPSVLDIATMVSDALHIYGWNPSSDGNVVKIGIGPFGDDDKPLLPEMHFRAVVVEGEETPVLLAGPGEAKIRADERARCVAELRTYSEKCMAAAVTQTISGNGDGGLLSVAHAAAVGRAAELLESGELTAPSLSVSSGEADTNG